MSPRHASHVTASAHLLRLTAAFTVHCKGGKGRTGTMICALLMMIMSISSEEAIDLYGR
jgi:protein-tyrosine phosphatase